MKVSQRVQASTLEDLDLANANAEPKAILMAKEMSLADTEEMKNLTTF
mgnify:CR=1 FL=1